MKVHRFVFVAAFFLAGISSVSQAQSLRFSFADPAGDNPATIPDVVGLAFHFDQATGDYEILLTADAASPFAPTAPASLGVYINLFNPDVGVLTPDPSDFQLISDLQLSAPTTSLTLTGTNGRLTAWNAGDRVAIESVLGNPNGTGLFGSVVRVVQGRMIFGEDRIAPSGVAIIAVVPEPRTAALLFALVAAVVVSAKTRCG